MKIFVDFFNFPLFMSFSGLFLPCLSFSVTVLLLTIPMYFPFKKIR